MKRLSLVAAALTTLFLSSGCCCGLLHGGGGCCNSCGYGSASPMYAPAPSSCPTGNCGASYTPSTSFYGGSDVMTASTGSPAPVLASAAPSSLPTF